MRSTTFERAILDPFYHEFRTSLTLIQTCTDLLMNVDVTDPNDLRNFLQIIRRGGTRIDRLVRDFILLAKAENGMLNDELGSDPIDLLPPLNLALLEVRSESSERAIDIVTDLPAALPQVRIHPDHLRLIIERLLEVTMRFAQKDGDAIVVQSRVTPEQAGIVFTAEGLRIAESDLPHIFDRFFVPQNLPDSGERPGLGLDLAVTKMLVEIYGGEISVESVANGNVFCFTVPRA